MRCRSIYKQPVTAHLYVVLTLFSMSSCMISIGIAFYVTVRSEKSANEVSVRHTVALVRQLKGGHSTQHRGAPRSRASLA